MTPVLCDLDVTSELPKTIWLYLRKENGYSVCSIDTNPAQTNVLSFSTAWYGTVRFTFGGFSTGFCTWYFFNTTSAGVPSDPYRYQNMTRKLLLITDWPEKILFTASLNLRHEDPTYTR